MKNSILYVFAVIGAISLLLSIYGMVENHESNNDAIQSNSGAKKSGDEEMMDLHLPQQVMGIQALDSPSFAGELIPMNIDTRERLDRELTVNSYYHSSTILNLKLSKRFFPIIEPILARLGVPDDFKYLAVAESSLRNATSPANAKGIWQIMSTAAKEMGLEVNGEVDERYHIEKATEAAGKYLLKQYERFGSWIDAAAAYNMGPTGLANVMKAQGSDDYFDLNVNEETSRYIFRLVALKEIMSNPTDYGFYLQEKDYYPGYENTYLEVVKETVPSWADFASERGISYKLLKFYNPWLRDNKLTVVSNTYFIRLPR